MGDISSGELSVPPERRSLRRCRGTKVFILLGWLCAAAANAEPLTQDAQQQVEAGKPPEGSKDGGAAIGESKESLGGLRFAPGVGFIGTSDSPPLAPAQKPSIVAPSMTPSSETSADSDVSRVFVSVRWELAYESWTKEHVANSSASGLSAPDFAAFATEVRLERRSEESIFVPWLSVGAQIGGIGSKINSAVDDYSDAT